MKILVLNCGSSSIKYQLFEIDKKTIIAKGGVEKVGLKGSFIKHEKQDGNKVRFEGEILDHKTGVEYILGILISKKHGCIKDFSEIDAVGHRVVHGGEKFKKSILIDDEVINAVKELVDLAPLHNPANLKGIEAITALIPGIRQVAVFDTSFHQTMPAHSYMYGIPYSLYKKYGIRRYGFHGSSHRYVSKRACEILNVDIKDKRMITCHLGNGASIAAIEYGKSVDTSMGFTPTEGLMMGTRSGDLDLGVFTYIMEKEEIGIAASNTLVNKHSGILGITGISSDMREIEKAAWEDGNKRAELGLDMYFYRVKKYIGAYAAAMGGVDILVFTGGIGENGPESRETICLNMEYMGIKFDKTKNNKKKGKEVVISTDDSYVTVIVVPTDEELVISLDTQRIIQSVK